MVYDVGVAVAGPVLWLFGHWLVHKAKQHGVTKLAFLARDGYLAYRAVEHILRARPDIKLDLRYVYGSRFTYNVLDIERLGVEEWDRLVTVGGHRYSTISSLEKALFCEPIRFKAEMKSLGFEDTDWARPLSDAEMGRIQAHALSDERFNTAILGGLREVQALTLESIGNFETDGGLALVDAGWTTRSHAPLFRFLERAGCGALRLFYIGVTVRETKVRADAVDAFVFDRRRGLGPDKSDVYYNRAVESLFLCDHGRTRSLKKEGAAVVPVLDPVENKWFVDRYFKAYQDGVDSFFEEMGDRLGYSSPIYDMHGVAESIIARFWREPTREEALMWSRLTWEYDPLGTVIYQLARPYAKRDAVRAFRSGKLPECHPQFWWGGARALTSKTNLSLLECVIALRTFADRVRSMLHRPLAALLFGRTRVQSP